MTDDELVDRLKELYDAAELVSIRAGYRTRGGHRSVTVHATSLLEDPFPGDGLTVVIEDHDL